MSGVGVGDHCPKCNGRMVQGYVLDNTHGAHDVSQWAEGEPVKSLWVGTKLPKQAMLPIGAYRCEYCGFLEFYARHEFGAT